MRSSDKVNQMSCDAAAIDKLTALYEIQSPSAFTAFAMHGLPESEHAERYDKGDHDGGGKCDYCCCDEKGCCTSSGWYACLAGGVICCCACCCYITHGFNGVWTYWPF